MASEIFFSFHSEMIVCCSDGISGAKAGSFSGEARQKPGTTSAAAISKDRSVCFMTFMQKESLISVYLIKRKHKRACGLTKKVRHPAPVTQTSLRSQGQNCGVHRGCLHRLVRLTACGDTNHASRRDGSACTLKPQFAESNLYASRDFQFSNAPHRRDLTTDQITIQILKVVLEIIQRLSLRQIVRKLLKVADPEPLILPINVSKAFHVNTINEKGLLGNTETNEKIKV